ncbi:thioredoxin-like protein, partial [Microthyrium microscopicum]
KKKWLVLLFLPATFSRICPTEVIAFDKTLEEFTERNCEILVISTDSVHSLWQWQQVPKERGGVGDISIALLSDQNHYMSKDYGVLIEKAGIALRGTYIIDAEGTVQYQAIQNIVVGRSVLETLRLVEAFQ